MDQSSEPALSRRVSSVIVAPYVQQKYDIDDNIKIIIRIRDPKLTKGTVKSFMTYTIEGRDRDGDISIQRRYTDFKQLRTILQQRWPACYIPPLPPKQTIGNTSYSFVVDRQDSLLHFCEQIATIKYLWYSQEFQIFIRSEQYDLEQRFNQLPVFDNEFLLEKYQIVFKKTCEKTLTLQVMNRLTNIRKTVESIMPMMVNFRKIAFNICQTRQESSAQYYELYNSLLPKYETIVLQEYIYAQDEKLIFSPELMDPQLKLVLEENQAVMKSHELYNFYEILRIQIKELKGLQDTFRVIDNYIYEQKFLEERKKEIQLKLQRIMAGKMSIRNILQGVEKHDLFKKTQIKLQQTQKALDSITYLYDILMKMLGFIELDRFESTKLREYYGSVKVMAKFEIRLAEAKQKFFELMLESPGFDPTKQHCLSLMDSSVRLSEVKDYIEQRNSLKQIEEEFKALEFPAQKAREQHLSEIEEENEAESL